MYTTGFLPKLSERGQKLEGQRPRKIIVISNWLSTTSVVPIVTPISRAGNKASIANATTDIKEAISATNSNWEVSIFFLHWAKIRYWFGFFIVFWDSKALN
jgi:hypothetical protein